MGDRGNIVMDFGEGKQVWFYTHWSGSTAPLKLRNALALRQRWDDPAYLARIIFQTLLDGDTGATGFGISVSAQDNEHAILFVDAKEQRVNLKTEGGELISSWPFVQFVVLSDAEVERLGRIGRNGESY